MENSAMSLTDQFYVDPVNYEMPDWDEFYNEYGMNEFKSGKVDAFESKSSGLFSDITNFFTGTRDRAWQEYERQKEAKLRAYEEAKLKSARDYQLYTDSTKYQRAMDDIRKAGYNPALLLQSGLGAANVQPGPGSNRVNARFSDKKADNGSDAANILTSAMKVIATIAMLAA